MSYHCGIGDNMRKLGLEPCDPHIVCDGCGHIRLVFRGLKPGLNNPPAWFLNGKKVPGGWSGGRVVGTTVREDYCPECTRQRDKQESVNSR